MDEKTQLEQRRFYFIEYLRAFAAVLVINSHFDSLYPVSAVATGGAIGNALFFAVSGFCLWPIRKKFGSWYGEKVKKLYIPTIIMTLIVIILGNHILSLSNVFFTFIWPTPFWFIGAIILFYLLFYLMKGVREGWHFAVLFFVLSGIYFLYYVILLDTSKWTIESGNIYTVNGFFRLIYYFAAMMIGKYFRINADKTWRYPALYSLYIILGGGSLYFVKYLMNRNNWLMNLQFLNQLSVLVFVVGVFMLGLSIESHIVEKMIVYKAAKKIGALTLYLYLVQFPCIYFSEQFIFPVNVLVAVALIGIFAVLLQKISETLINLVWKRQKRESKFDKNV